MPFPTSQIQNEISAVLRKKHNIELFLGGKVGEKLHSSNLCLRRHKIQSLCKWLKSTLHLVKSCSKCGLILLRGNQHYIFMSSWFLSIVLKPLSSRGFWISLSGLFRLKSAHFDTKTVATVYGLPLKLHHWVFFNLQLFAASVVSDSVFHLTVVKPGIAFHYCNLFGWEIGMMFVLMIFCSSQLIITLR